MAAEYVARPAGTHLKLGSGRRPRQTARVPSPAKAPLSPGPGNSGGKRYALGEGGNARRSQTQSRQVTGSNWAKWGLFPLTTLLGAAMVASSWWLPRSTWANLVVLLFAVMFSLSFLLTLVHRLIRIYAGHRVWFEYGLCALAITGLIFGYALVHWEIGIIDTTAKNDHNTNFVHCLYLSVITLTTVGYGDFLPKDQGRLVASVQGLTGYLVLALMASTFASVLQKAGKKLQDSEEIAATGPVRGLLVED